MNIINGGLFDRSENTLFLDTRPLIMVVGIGDLAKHVVNQLVSNYATSKIVLAGRNLDTVVRRANLAKYSAANQGYFADISACEMDLIDIDRTAKTLHEQKPDIVLMTASLQSWRRITELPKPFFDSIDETQLGPWLPMHLALNYNLMTAIKRAGIKTMTVNAAFPDAVNPILNKVGLAPDLGSGNVANIIPALTFGVAAIARLDPRDVQVRLVAQHYFTHYVPRYGHEGNGAYQLSATNVKTGNEIVFDHRYLFKMLNTRLKRQGGVEGQLLTASSTSRVIAAIAEDNGVVAHVPGPNGLPGGYPVRVDAEGAKLDLPVDLTTARAIEINQLCQQADGIERIDDDGTTWFTDREMSVMNSHIGYNAKSMALSDVWECAKEIEDRYTRFKHHLTETVVPEVA